MVQMKLGEFVTSRIADAGCFHVFGVPGDYSLNLMNAVVADSRVDMINCLNELNASYAAEAYARVNGFGAVVVVMGVGELCTLNGLGLANAEKIPLLLIVGVIPSCHVKNDTRARHMTDPYDQMRGTHTTSSCVEASVHVDSMDGIIDRIDDLITISLNRKRPVALHIPADFQVAKIDVPAGREHLRYSNSCPRRGLPLRAPLDAKQTAEIEHLAENAASILNAARNPVMMVGNQVVCYGLQKLVIEMAQFIQCPVMQVPRLSGIISRDHPLFMNARPVHDKSSFDCIVQIGFDLCDMYASVLGNRKPEIKFSVLGVEVGDYSISSAYFPDIMEAMMRYLTPANEKRVVSNSVELKTYSCVAVSPQMKYFVLDPYTPAPARIWYPRVAPQPTERTTFSESDKQVPLTVKQLAIWAAEHGSEQEVRVCCSGLTVWDMLAYPSVHSRPQYIQEFYATIGWALPATLGVVFAYQTLNPSQQPVFQCWIGDGAFMMTAQELGALQRYSSQLKVVVQVYLLDNKGYLIERVIHENIYNDLPSLDYEQLAQFSKCNYARVRTLADLEETAKNKIIGTTLVHLDLDKYDCIDPLGAIKFGEKLCIQNKIPTNRPTLPGF